MLIRLQRGAGAVILVLVLLSQSCAVPPPTASTPATVKVALQPFLSFAPLFIATEEGYFAEQGLNIEYVTVAPDQVIPALVQGKVDVLGELISVGTLNTIARGGKIKIVADRGYNDPEGCPLIAVMGQRSLVEAGKLDDVASLRDKRVDVPELSWSAYYVDRLLATAGLSLDDVLVTNVPPPAEFQALEQGQIDASVTAEPTITRLKQAGHSALFTPVQELLPDSQFAIMIYGPTLLDENRDAGNRFMTAYLKGVHQYNQGKTDRNVEIVAKHTELDPALVRAACWASIHDDGTINVQSVLDFQAWAVEKEYLDNPVTEEQFWDPSFVEYASEALGTASP